MFKQYLLFLGIVFLFIKSDAAIYTVNNTGSTGAGTLDQAISDANGSAGPHTIRFTGLTGTGPWTFTNGGNPMRDLTRADVTIDGTSLPAGSPYNCTTGPQIIVVGAGFNEFQVSGSGSVIRAISFRGHKVYLNAANIILEGCWFNLDNTGTAGSGGTPGSSGFLLLDGCTNCIVGGSTCGKSNTFSGADASSYYGGGILTITNSSGAQILNNFFGTNEAGTTVLNTFKPRGHINASSTSNLIIDGNVIAASAGSGTDNLGYGICLDAGMVSPTIRNNKIGVSSAGTVAGGSAFGNDKAGIIVLGQATGMLIENNTICFNGKLGSSFVQDCGIVIQGSSTSTGTIQNNYIGVDASNGLGGNKFYGIYLYQYADPIIIKGNTIGDNGDNGDVARYGGGITCAVGTTVKNISMVGNYIGTSASSANIGNHNNGIHLESGPSLITIGGTAAADKNYICYNKGKRTDPNGAIFLAGVTDVTILNNSIGVPPSGALGAGQNNIGFNLRGGNGIYAEGATTLRIKVGGMDATDQNVIAYNRGNGIQVYKGADYVQMRWNKLFCNGDIGINLNCASGSPNWGNNGFGCSDLSITGPVPTTPTSLSGNRPANSIVDVFGTSSCASSASCISQGEYRYASGTYTPSTSGVAGTTWSYNNGSPMWDDLSALATGAGADCNAGVCRTSQFSPCVDNLLPVSFVSFEANPLDKVVEVSWSTASELNNLFFIVERSSDGVNFKESGKVAGAGTTNNLSEYHFNDENPVSGISFYRLKQVDFDGLSSYSNIVKVNYKKDWLITLYPNPSNGIFKVEFSCEELSEYLISIYSLDGKLVDYRDKKSGNTAAIHESFNLTSLPLGLYIVKVEVGDRQQFLKLEKQ